MKAAVAALWVLTVVAAFGLARLTGGDRDLRSADFFRAALEARDPLTRSAQLSAFLEELGPDELPAALEALEAREETGLTLEEVRLFMLAWARFDAPAAFAWARDWPTGWSQTLMSEAMFAWGFHDGGAALVALEGVEDSERERLRRSLLEGWIRSDDPEEVSEYIATLPRARSRNMLTGLLARETSKQGVEAVVRWAEAVPEDAPNDFKQGVFYHAAGAVARADPRRAAEWFEAHRTHSYSAGSLKAIARSWASHQDAWECFDWLRSLPAAEGRESERGDAKAFAFRFWSRRAPEEAEAWLRSAVPDPELDSTLVQLVRDRSQSSPRSALEFALRIQDERQRQRSVRLAGRSWARKDPEAVRAWLAESDLPEEWQRLILKGTPAIARRRGAAPPAEPAAP